MYIPYTGKFSSSQIFADFAFFLLHRKNKNREILQFHCHVVEFASYLRKYYFVKSCKCQIRENYYFSDAKISQYTVRDMYMYMYFNY